MNIQKFELEVFADYYQFYLQDGLVFPDAPTNWTDKDVQCRAKVADNVVAICPLRNMTVPVELNIHEVASEMYLEEADHVIRCSLAIPSGVLQVHECTGGELLRCQVPPGHYGVLVEFTGLETISEDGLDGGDAYRISVWPDRPIPLIRSQGLPFCRPDS